MSININLWAVLVGSILAFILGGLWYSPLMFLNTWLKESGRTADQKKHGAGTYALALILYFIAALVFAIFLGPNPALPIAVMGGVIAGVAWVATSFGINYLFAGRSFKLFLIDGGYHVFQFAIYGLVLGLWH